MSSLHQGRPTSLLSSLREGRWHFWGASTVSLMTKLLLPLVLLGVLSTGVVVSVSQQADVLEPAMAETVGVQSVLAVVEAAQLTAMVSGRPVEDELAAGVLRDGSGAVTVDGSRVTWSVDGHCWTAVVTSPEAPVDVVAC